MTWGVYIKYDLRIWNIAGNSKHIFRKMENGKAFVNNLLRGEA